MKTTADLLHVSSSWTICNIDVDRIQFTPVALTSALPEQMSDTQPLSVLCEYPRAVSVLKWNDAYILVSGSGLQTEDAETQSESRSQVEAKVYTSHSAFST